MTQSWQEVLKAGQGVARTTWRSDKDVEVASPGPGLRIESAEAEIYRMTTHLSLCPPSAHPQGSPAPQGFPRLKWGWVRRGIGESPWDEG